MVARAVVSGAHPTSLLCTRSQAAAQERQRGLENLATRLKKKTEKQAKQITALKRAHDEADV